MEAKFYFESWKESLICYLKYSTVLMELHLSFQTGPPEIGHLGKNKQIKLQGSTSLEFQWSVTLDYTD